MTNIIYVAQCSTTMEEIIPFISQNTSEILGLYTLNQTHGRGQYGNRWETSKDENIALSIAIPEARITCSNTTLNYYTALLIKDFLSHLSDKMVKIKWPNDIIITNKKVCGFIIEYRKIFNSGYYIVGIGLNVLQNNFDKFPKAGSLLTATSKVFNPHSVAESLHEFLASKFLYLQLPPDLISEYNLSLFKRNEVGVFTHGNIRQNGIIKEADEEGYLWIELEHEGLKKFYHKEIEMHY